MPIGFYISFKIDTRNYNKKILRGNLLVLKKIIIAFAGPMINLMFIIVFIIFEKQEILNVKTEILVYMNILIFLFNMITIYPLDGGRILKNLLYIFFGKIISLKITNIISNITALVLTIIVVCMAIYLKSFLYILVLLYIWVIVIKENKICYMKIKMYRILKNCIEINQD